MWWSAFLSRNSGGHASGPVCFTGNAGTAFRPGVQRGRLAGTRHADQDVLREQRLRQAFPPMFSWESATVWPRGRKMPRRHPLRSPQSHAESTLFPPAAWGVEIKAPSGRLLFGTNVRRFPSVRLNHGSKRRGGRRKMAVPQTDEVAPSSTAVFKVMAHAHGNSSLGAPAGQGFPSTRRRREIRAAFVRDFPPGGDGMRPAISAVVQRVSLRPFVPEFQEKADLLFIPHVHFQQGWGVCPSPALRRPHEPRQAQESPMAWDQREMFQGLAHPASLGRGTMRCHSVSEEERGIFPRPPGTLFSPKMCWLAS